MKLLHEDAENYHVQHDNGSTMTLKKSALSPASKALLEGLKPQHFDQGGQPQPSPSPVPLDPTKAQSAQDSMRKAFNFAGGGDVMGHQTTHRPNAKLGQVPDKDRYPNSTFHAANGGPPPENDEVSKNTAHIQDEIQNPAYRPNPQQQLEQDMNETTNERRARQHASQPIVQHFYMGGQPPQHFANGGGSFLQSPPPQDYVTAAPASNPPDAAAQAGGPAAATPPPPVPSTPAMDPLTEGLGGEQQELQGLGQEAAAKGKIGSAAASAYDTEGAGLAKAPNVQEAFDDLHQKYEAMAGQMDPRIDPEHYWTSKDTPNRILAAVGFMIGGAGLGAAGHPELGLQAVQSAVNRDIEAQKATFNNQDSLLKSYTQQFNSAVLGEQATRVHLAAQVENEINRAAAQQAGPLAQAAANRLKGALRMSIAPQMANLALASTQYRLLTDPKAMAQLPLTSKIQYTLPADQQAEAQKQATAYEANKNAHANIDDIFDKLDQEQSTGNLVNPQSYSRVSQLLGRLTPTILDASPSKRLTKESIDKEIEPFKYTTFADKATRDAARESVHRIVDNSSDPMNILKDHGLIPQQTYARKPGMEPGKPQYKISGGKKYMRGPNGEAIEVK
jgi:hypothetical protein